MRTALTPADALTERPTVRHALDTATTPAEIIAAIQRVLLDVSDQAREKFDALLSSDTTLGDALIVARSIYELFGRPELTPDIIHELRRMEP